LTVNALAWIGGVIQNVMPTTNSAAASSDCSTRLQTVFTMPSDQAFVGECGRAGQPRRRSRQRL
jgi:hypothetical protein